MKLPRLLLLVSLFVVATSSSAAAQRARNAAGPREVVRSSSNAASTAHLLPASAVDRMVLEPINRRVVRKEDEQRLVEGRPPRFAIPHAVSVTPFDAGTWEDLDATTLLWRYRVTALGAQSINLGFTTYKMPEGGELHVYSTDVRHVVRPFTAADNAAHGELWTPVVRAEDLMIELALPRERLAELELELTQVGYGYRGFPATDIAAAVASGSCNYDVICPEGDDWRLDIPSVGAISTGGSIFCTGFMVNNTSNDLTPYFMTANHCGIGPGNAASLVVYWNYENSTCRPPGSGASGGPGDGVLTEFNTGSFFRAAYSPSDVTLVELDSDPDPAFDVSYAGWDRSGAEASTAIAIHQPNGDEKRISFEFQATTTTTYLQNSVPGDGTHHRVIDWDLGTTEPGSSGSPLFNQDHRVIGQLHGGFASCTSQTSDWYGKFSVSWNGGGTSSTRLSNWLDAAGTGAMTVDTVSLATLCSDAGTVALDRTRYSCEDTAVIEVIDCGLNTNDAAVETTMVTVDSDSEPAGEVVMLTETGLNTGRFEGSLPLSGTDGVGILLVGPGDTVTVTYVDADDGMGGFGVIVTDTAIEDCTAPMITNVQITELDARDAKVTITVDEASRGRIRYGTSCATLGNSEEGTGILELTDEVELTGLQPNTTYFFRAEADDEAGNTAIDDNGGGCYAFTTLDAPDFLTEQFDGDYDLSFTRIVFDPAGGPTGYVACAESIGGLSVDPTGHANLGLSDDGSAQIVLTGGQTVSLYGSTHGSLWACANGNITFGSGDSDYTESLDDHFERERISVLFNDFNPASAGSVVWAQLSNRVVVTWLGVPEYSTSNSNTFQCELFFDGRIRLTYAGMDAPDGIAGLSGGAGVDPDFVETDQSAHDSCFDTLSDRDPQGVVGPNGPLSIGPQ